MYQGVNIVNLLSHRYAECEHKLNNEVVKWIQQGANAYTQATIDNLLSIFEHFYLAESIINRLPTLCNNFLAHSAAVGNNDAFEYFIQKCEEFIQHKSTYGLSHHYKNIGLLTLEKYKQQLEQQKPYISTNTLAK